MNVKLLSDGEIGERVKETREALGWSQDALAARLGMGKKSGQGDISKWENGKRPVPSHHRQKIAELAGRPATYLFFDEERDEAAEDKRDRLAAAEWMDKLAGELRRSATLQSADGRLPEIRVVVEAAVVETRGRKPSEEPPGKTG